MKKTLASIVLALILTSALGCANWNRMTPKGMDDDAIAAEIRKNETAAGYTGLTINVHNGAVMLKGDVTGAPSRPD